GFFQCHAVHLAGAKRLEIAANARDEPIGRCGSRFERVVVAHVDVLTLDRPAVDRKHLVLQDGRVVVQLPLEDGPVGNLDELGRDLDATPSRELGVRARGCSALLLPAARGRHETDYYQEASVNDLSCVQSHKYPPPLPVQAVLSRTPLKEHYCLTR